MKTGHERGMALRIVDARRPPGRTRTIGQSSCDRESGLDPERTCRFSKPFSAFGVTVDPEFGLFVSTRRCEDEKNPTNVAGRFRTARGSAHVSWVDVGIDGPILSSETSHQSAGFGP